MPQISVAIEFADGDDAHEGDEPGARLYRADGVFAVSGAAEVNGFLRRRLRRF